MSDQPPGTPIGFRYDEQVTPPGPQRVSDVAITTHPHLFEVDPRLMQRWVLQQEFPNWDSLRIMGSRADHLEWMHRHFADRVVTGSELLAEVDGEGGDGDVRSSGDAIPRDSVSAGNEPGRPGPTRRK
jgi:hypothetical protein